jgi:hypothetical protein
MSEDLGHVTSAELQEAYDKAQGELTPDKLTLNDEYKVDIRVKVGDKSVNFGTALVAEITSNGVTFKSTGVETKGKTKYINTETLGKILKGKVSTDMRAEEIVEEIEITPQEEELLEESKENVKPLSKEQMKVKQEEALTMSASERRQKLKEGRKKRCKG